MDTHDRRHNSPIKEEIAAVEAARPVIDTFGILIFFVIVVEIVLLLGLGLYQKSRINTLTTKLGEKKAYLQEPANITINTQINEVLAGKDRLQTILENKTRWSTFYTLLNGVTPKNVKVSALSVSENGVFRAEGTTPTLADLARLLVAWEKGSESVKTPFSKVTLNSNAFSAVGSGQVVTFSVSGQVNTGVLR